MLVETVCRETYLPARCTIVTVVADSCVGSLDANEQKSNEAL